MRSILSNESALPGVTRRGFLGMSAAGLTVLKRGVPGLRMDRQRLEIGSAGVARGQSITTYPKAITDRRIVPYPENPPDPGQAGSTIIEPFVGNRILRVTDAETDPSKPGSTFTTPSSSTANPWSANTQAFVVHDKDNTYFLYDFNPQTFAATPRGRLARSFRNCYFSARDPNVLWGYTGELKIEQLNISTGESRVIVDLSNYPQIPTNPRWYLNGIAVDWFDQRVCVMLGPGQDKSYLVLVYDVKQGLEWLNTQTGEFNGWRQGRIENWEPFLLHFVGLNETGGTVLMGPPVSGDIRFWQPGTAIFEALMASDTVPTHGHNAIGFQTFYGLDSEGPFSWIQAPIWQLELFEYLLQEPVEGPTGWWSDFHMSVQPDGGDRFPILISTENVQGNPTTPGAPLTSEAPGDNEILALAADGSGDWWRLAHHYSTGKDENFWSKPRGNVSLNGRFFMFTSDWEITLGGEFPNQRTDVFILAMR